MADMKKLICLECGSEWIYEQKEGRTPSLCSETCRKARRRKSREKWRAKNKHYHKDYYQKNKDTLHKKQRDRIMSDPEPMRQYNQEYRAKNRDRLKAQNREYYEKNKERITVRNEEYRKRNSDWYREYKKSYYLENQEDVKERARKNYLNNRVEKLNYQRRYALENPDVVKAGQDRYRARKTHSWKEDVSKEFLLERDGWRCHICKGEIPKGLSLGHPLYPHVEHIVPLSKGGEHSYGNTAPAHASCNLQKGNKLDGWQNIKPILNQEEQA